MSTQPIILLLVHPDPDTREQAHAQLCHAANGTPTGADQVVAASPEAALALLQRIAADEPIQTKTPSDRSEGNIVLEESLNHVLGLIANSAPLQVILNALNIGVERAAPGLYSSVLLLDKDGLHLRHGSAPNLPESYCQSIDGVAIGPGIGSCGTAAYRRARVVVEDIAIDPLWQDYKELALTHGLRACWSQPIFSSSQILLGTFAAYYLNPRSPSTAEISLIERAAQLAGIAIEKKQAELALRDSREELRRRDAQLRLTLETATAGFLICRNDGEIVVANRAFCQMLGYPFEEMIGCSIDQFADPADVQQARTLRKRLRSKELTHFQWERSFRRKDGLLITTAERLGTVFDDNGVLLQIVSEVEDITEKKRWEAEFHRAARLESVGLLASSIAHDFKNIVSGILGCVTIARPRIDMSDPLARNLDDIDRAAHRAAQLAEQLLDIARGQQLQRRRFSLGTALRDSVRIALNGSNIACELNINDDLGAIEGDEGQLTQVIHNLLLNARQALPNGGKIRISSAVITFDESSPLALDLPSGSYLHLMVQDDGEGMTSDTLNKAFLPFFTTKPNGHGLGLYASSQIVKNHGGRIVVDSTQGQGTIVHLYLPHTQRIDRPEREQLRSAESVAVETISQPESMLATGAACHRILIMDDDQLVRETAGCMLGLLGYQVEYATDGTEVLDRYRVARSRGEPFDAVLIDLSVKLGMGGESTIGRLRRIDPLVRAIVTSGYTQDPVMLNYARYGFTGAVSKPFRLDALQQSIEQAIHPTRALQTST